MWNWLWGGDQAAEGKIMEDCARRSGQNADAADAESDEPPLREVQVENSPLYTIGEKLGKGGFGQVHVGERTGSKDKVAVKFESIDPKRCQKSPIEWQAYKALCRIHGLPRMHYHGSQGDFHITVMDLLGPSLRNCRKKMSDKISEEWVETVKYIATKAITVLKDVHSEGYVHGDIKPSNLLLGPSETYEQLFLVDFGLATRWKDAGRHVEYDQQPSIFSFSGTVDYASVHTHLGRTRSRRDDLESLAYTLIFLLRGDLPWKEHKGDNRKFLVCKDKMSRSPESLCCSLPQGSQPFREFFEYVVELKFDEEPDYAGCISLFEGGGCPKGSITKQPMRARTGKPATQWISVYDARQPMKQRYHYGVADVNLAYFIEKGKEEKLLIRSVASCDNLWALIIDAGTGFSDQIYEHLPNFPDTEWVGKRLKEDYYITAIAGANNGRCLIVLSKGTQYKQQNVLVATVFPFEKIKTKQKDGFYITSMATAGSEWAVVMSKSHDVDVDLEQVVELDFAYPFEGIHRRWDNGFLITATAATPEQAAFVFTRPRKPTGKARQQDTYQTSNFPSEYIKKKWAKNIYITSLCYGQTIS